jgi:hypothetical protein
LVSLSLTCLFYLRDLSLGSLSFPVDWKLSLGSKLGQSWSSYCLLLLENHTSVLSIVEQLKQCFLIFLLSFIIG